MKRMLTVGVLVVVALGCSPAPESSPVPDVHAERLARIEAELLPALILEGLDEPPATLAQRMEDLNVPAVSAVMWSGGEIVWAKAWGVADIESGRPATPATLFQAASISKPVAAMGLMALVEGGHIGLEQNVNELLTSWQVPGNEFTDQAPVTTRRLLSHTAGTTVHGFPGYARGFDRPSAVDVLNGTGNTDPVVVDVVPGSIWRYSGGGYTIAQQLATDVSGRTFEDLLRETVLEPLGMNASTYEQPLPEARWDEAATAYRGDGDPVDTGWHVYPEQAAAGLWTTPSDLAAFAMAIQRAQAGGEHPVLSGETIEAMLEPHLEDYGLGLGLMEDGAFFGHGGSNAGFRCNLVAVSGGDSGMVIMTNGARGGVLGAEFLFSVAREEGWTGFEPTVRKVITLPDDKLQALLGRYSAEAAPGAIRVYEKEGDLWIVSEWDDDHGRFVAESEELIFDPESGFEMTIEWSEGAPAVLRGAGLEFIPIE